MMKRTIKHTLLLLVFAVFMSGCKDDLELPTAKNSIKPLRENPFSVQAMVNAQRKLEGSAEYAAAGSPKLNPRVTHYYVVFSPKNESEMNILRTDQKRVYSKMPLDVSFLGEERAIFEYNLSDLGEDSPGHQFTTVSKDYVFPDVSYEIIAEIYLPFEDPELLVNTQLDTRGVANDQGLSCEQFMLAQAWENQSLEDSGYADFVEEDDCDSPPDDGGYTGGGGGSAYPSNIYGRIMYFDNTHNENIPVEGVEVITQRFLSSKKSSTDQNGYYRVSSQHRGKKADYKLKWERYDFSIRDSKGAQTKKDGPNNRETPWSITFNNDSHHYYAQIFRAAYHYYYKDILNLRRPPKNSLLSSQMKIKAEIDGASCNDPIAAGCFNKHIIKRFLGLGNPIVIQSYNHRSRTIYATVIHELAHASHWNMDHYSYRNSESDVKESWARGVEWALTNLTYENYSIPNHRNLYTPVVRDLMDGVKTVRSNGVWRKNDEGNLEFVNTNTLIYMDKTEGYTIRQIEDALKDEHTWEAWRDKIKRLYNPTKQHVDEVFSYWSTID